MIGVWTFEQMAADGTWTMSALRGTFDQALTAATEWMRVSAENGTRPGVRLMRMSTHDGVPPYNPAT